MSFFKEYISEIETRRKEGLKPKPIDDADLIKEIIDNIKHNNNKDQSLKFIHTHFNDIRFKSFNSFMVNKMIQAKLYKHVLIIERMK